MRCESVSFQVFIQEAGGKKPLTREEEASLGKRGHDAPPSRVDLVLALRKTVERILDNSVVITGLRIPENIVGEANAITSDQGTLENLIPAVTIAGHHGITAKDQVRGVCIGAAPHRLAAL